MKKRLLGWGRLFLFGTMLVGGLVASPTLSAAQGLLETPQPGSFQSGVGLIRGWVCQASNVAIEVVGLGTLPAVYGEPRGDTQATCRDTNNGFSLQFNWNDLGEGIHTVRALADGVEFGRAQITVATLGQSFLQGAQGEFVVQPFPQTGRQARIRWLEPRQGFVLSNGGTPSSGGGNPRTDAKLEDPTSGSFQSGIGAIRGFVCNATRVDIQVDSRTPITAVYRQPRGDTQAVCGDTDNGFSLQVNWNDIGDGTHVVRALADGVEFSQATFTVVTLGLGSFPTGLSGNFTVANFPQAGLQTQVQWQESQQNFVVTGARFPGMDGGLCTTRSGQANDGNGGIADVSWGNPCLLSGNTAVLRVQTRNAAALLDTSEEREERAAAGGAFFTCGSQLTIRQGGRTFTSEDFRLVDIGGNDACRDIARGEIVNFLLQVRAQSELNFNAPFTVFYNGQSVVDFPGVTAAGAPKLGVSADDLNFSTSATAALTELSLVGTDSEATDEREERAQVGPSQEKTFIVTNTGGGTLRGGMALIATPSSRDAFSIVSDAQIELGAGQNQTVTVRFTPQSTAPVVGSIRITTSGGVKRVLLRGGGQGTPDPKVGASVTSIDFGTVQLGTLPELSFVATNTGGGTLTGTVDSLPNSPFTVMVGKTLNLPAGQNQTVTVRLTPEILGALSDRVTLNTNGGTLVVLLFANIVGQPRLSVNPTQITLSNVQLPNSASGTFTITNTGTGTLSGSVTVANGNAFTSAMVNGMSAPFSLASGGNFTLDPNQSQVVTISFSTQIAGTFTGTANVTSNGGQASVSLSATAVQPGPVLSISPTAVNFGPLSSSQNQCSTGISSFRITNTGGGTLTGEVSTSGSSTNFPTFATSPFIFSLGAGQSQTITVVWRPTGTGTDTATSTVSSNGGNGSVSLSGSCTTLTSQ